MTMVCLQYGFADRHVDECNHKFTGFRPFGSCAIQTVGLAMITIQTRNFRVSSGHVSYIYGDGKGGDDDNPYDGGYGVTVTAVQAT